jgi:hypothetical protein
MRGVYECTVDQLHQGSYLWIPTPSAAQQQHSSNTAAAQQQHSSSTAAAQQQHSSTAAQQQHSSSAAPQQHSSSNTTSATQPQWYSNIDTAAVVGHLHVRPEDQEIINRNRAFLVQHLRQQQHPNERNTV